MRRAVDCAGRWHHRIEMKTLEVRCSDNPYRMLIGAGALEMVADELIRLGFSGTVVVVTDETVAGLFGACLEEYLRRGGLLPQLEVISPGEAQKNLETASALYSRLNDLGAERSTPMLALGGGVIGDLTGFVAATYFRGLPLVHVPTTLVAQVDSSIGGKVAVNHGRLKNNIGSFYQPASVVADTASLLHLPEREYRNGLAEVIKSAMIRDAQFFGYLESNIERVVARDSETLEYVVAVTAGIKATVVEEDEKDMGLRNILNFGHTVGHGIETASAFSIAHGEAVAIGMVAATRIASSMQIMSASCCERLKTLLQRAGLPVAVPLHVDRDDVVDAMMHDKKRVKGRLRFILPVSIGEVQIRDDVPAEQVYQTLEALYAGT